MARRRDSRRVGRKGERSVRRGVVGMEEEEGGAISGGGARCCCWGADVGARRVDIGLEGFLYVCMCRRGGEKVVMRAR